MDVSVHCWQISADCCSTITSCVSTQVTETIKTQIIAFSSQKDKMYFPACVKWTSQAKFSNSLTSPALMFLAPL